MSNSYNIYIYIILTITNYIFYTYEMLFYAFAIAIESGWVWVHNELNNTFCINSDFKLEKSIENYSYFKFNLKNILKLSSKFNKLQLQFNKAFGRPILMIFFYNLINFITNIFFLYMHFKVILNVYSFLIVLNSFMMILSIHLCIEGSNRIISKVCK